VTFVPTDFSESTLKKESSHSDKEEPELDYEAVLKNRIRTYDRKSKFHSWRQINSICVNPFAPGSQGPYYVEIYKVYGNNTANCIFVSVCEAQHLILKLVELISIGVDKHIKGLSSSK
jgi:hypothetical protein